MTERRGMKALELWCRRVTQGYPGVKVENMTTSWRDGMAFCAIIHHFRPDLIDFSRLDKSDIYGNNELAFRTAERHLGIPSLLDAEDMLEYPVPDRLSILTYLSLFYQAFASNGSSPMKRPAESSEGSLMIVPQSVQSTPTKVSVGSGREPCAVCNLPVFIAQRLRISDKLFHRTCFRCARCDNQLSPADYYETHDGQYCCEVCPDEMKEEEEKEVMNRPESPPALPVDKEVMTEAKPEPPEPPPPTPLKPSLVNLRKMMFETYSKDTDDAKQSKLGDSALSGNVNSYFQSNTKDLHIKDDYNLSKPSEKEDSLTVNSPLVDCVNKDLVAHLDEDPSISQHSECVNKAVLESISSVVDKSNDIVDEVGGLKSEPPIMCSLQDEISKSVDQTILGGSEKQPDSQSANCDKENISESINDVVVESCEIVSPSRVDTEEDNLECVNHNDDISDTEVLKYEDERSKSQSGILEAYNPVFREAASDLEIDHNDECQVPCELEIYNYSDNTISMYNDVDNTNNVMNNSTEKIEVANDLRSDTHDNTITDCVISSVNDYEVIEAKGKESSEDIVVEPKPISKVEIELEAKTPDAVVGSDQVDSCDDSPGNPFGLEREEEKVNRTLNLCVNKNVVDEDERDYPEDLNPFAEEEDVKPGPTTNPFGSDSEEEIPVKPTPQPLNKKFESSHSLNPFFSDEDEDDEGREVCLRKPPVPLPRRTLTPEPSPMPRNRLRSSGRSIGSVSSLASRKKKPAPLPPSPSPSISSLASTMSTPRRRKGRRAPAPPSPSSCRSLRIVPVPQDIDNVKLNDSDKDEGFKKEVTHRPHTVLVSIDIESKDIDSSLDTSRLSEDDSVNKSEYKKTDDTHMDQIIEQINELNSQLENKPVEIKTSSLTRRKRIVPLPVDYSYDDIPGFLGTPDKETKLSPTSTPFKSIGDEDYRLGELSSIPPEKKDKDSVNLQVQSADGETYNIDKSAYGQWRRKKGPAPSIPLPALPERRVLKPMPILKLKQELEDIEVKQQGLERQGVALEKKIREKFTSEASVTPYVEELVLQLFELVNEKNDLFRKQAELMYLRRQYHLEEEHAELEYQIRCLMARPEVNKTDSDKELEELLIQRLIEVVERRDAIVQCLERDRIREAEEDKSVNAQLNKFSEAVGTEKSDTKVEKCHKKNKKERRSASSIIDLDKDIDETVKEHKKKKKWFIHHSKTKH